MDWDKVDEAFTGQPITAADVAAALIVLVAGALLWWVLWHTLHRFVGRPGSRYQQLEKLAGRVVQWSVIAVSVAWALDILGVDVGWFPLFVLLGLLIVGFALRPLVESFVSSVLIASRPAFGVGDEICIDGFEGEVIEITERSVVLRRRDGARVHVPIDAVIRSLQKAFESAGILGAPSLEVQMVDPEPALGPPPDDAHRSDRTSAPS